MIRIEADVIRHPLPETIPMKNSLISALLLAGTFAIANAVPAAAPVGVGTIVCTAASNSVSPTGATLSASGSTSLTASTLTFDVAALPPSELGILLVGRAGTQFAFRDGFLCYDLTPGVGRLNLYTSTGAGDTSLAVNFAALPAPVPVVGTTWTFTVFYRDCMSTGFQANVTNGIEITFTP